MSETKKNAALPSKQHKIRETPKLRKRIEKKLAYQIPLIFARGGRKRKNWQKNATKTGIPGRPSLKLPPHKGKGGEASEKNQEKTANGKLLNNLHLHKAPEG